MVMTKEKFLKRLWNALRFLPRDERDDAMQFYTEHLNEAQDEQAAIAALPSPEQIAGRLMNELGIEPKRGVSPGMVVLIILSLPITIPLASTAFALAVAFFSVLLTLSLVPLILSLSFFAVGIAFLVFLVPAFLHNVATGILFLGMMLISLSLCVLTGILFIYVIKGFFRFIRLIYRAIFDRVPYYKERV